MTSTALMAVRSRSNLRVTSRRDPNDDGDINSHHPNRPPPSKRPRLHPPSSRRRKSSPDLLDTTIENPPSSVSKLAIPRRASTRRPPFPLSSSAHSTAGATAATTTSSSTSSYPPSASTPLSNKLRIHHYQTPPATSATLYLNGGPESPDPLDTISPAPASPPKSVPKLPPQRRTYAGHHRRRLIKDTVSAPIPPPDSTKPNPEPLSRRAIGPSPGDSQLQSAPAPAVTASPAVRERRSLRSHDGGSRARSELGLYFPNYEDLLSLEPPKTEFLASHTVIKLIDDLTETPIPASDLSALDTDTPFGNPLVNLHGCETITLPDPPAESEGGSHEDPLGEEYYFRAHRRNERQEKQLRNIERDRAQHEKQQLDRLLDELQSQDWLRIMGITGISDAEKKLYEPKRDYFIKEISALLQKFKIWKEEEKRRKLEKDKPSFSFQSDNGLPDTLPQETTNPSTKEGEVDSDVQSFSETPDVNDVDALAARQLHQEARSATAGKKPKQTDGRKKQPSTTKPDTDSRKPPTSPPPPPPLPEPEPDKPFTSFYSKPHLRELAMSKNRKSRLRFAFGQPIPEMEEQEFELPSDILTPEAIISCQRKRRRMKRASKG